MMALLRSALKFNGDAACNAFGQQVCCGNGCHASLLRLLPMIAPFCPTPNTRPSLNLMVSVLYLCICLFVYLCICICVVVCVTGHPGEGVHPGGVSGVLNPPATTAGPSPSLSTQLVLTTATLAMKKCQKLRLKSSMGVLTVSLSTQLVPTTATLSKTGRPCWLMAVFYVISARPSLSAPNSTTLLGPVLPSKPVCSQSSTLSP